MSLSLLKAAFKKANRNRIEELLSDRNANSFDGIEIERLYLWNDIASRARAYDHMHHWQGDMLHPCFLQVLGLDIQLACLLDKSSPFPLMGMVHIANRIQIMSPLQPADYLLKAKIITIKQHDKGAVASVNITASVAGKEVYSATSDYLYRMVSAESSSARGEGELPPVKLGEKLLDMSFAENAGRRYARLSQDYNPIHLWALSAKLLGFKQPIAHGMHTLALCISALNNNLGTARLLTGVENRFIAPASLPCKLSLYTLGSHGDDDNRQAFLLVKQDDVASGNELPSAKKPIIQGTVKTEGAE